MESHVEDVISETVSELFDMLGRGEAGRYAQPKPIKQMSCAHRYT